jgi:chromosome segregation ATPase
MAATIENRLHEIETKIAALKTDKIRAEERLGMLRQQRTDLLAKLAELNVTPETLDKTIIDMETTISAKLAELEKQLS